MSLYAGVGVKMITINLCIPSKKKKTVLKLTNLMMFYSAWILKKNLSFLKDRTKSLKINFPKSSVQNENDQARKKLEWNNCYTGCAKIRK